MAKAEVITQKLIEGWAPIKLAKGAERQHESRVPRTYVPPLTGGGGARLSR